MSGAGDAGTAGAGTGDRARLERLLGGGDLAWLLVRVRRRLERGQGLSGAVTLPGATPEQRAAAARLFGAPLRPGGSATVRLERLEALLRGSGAWPAGLESAVVALTGPYQRSADVREAQRAAWLAAWSPLPAALARHPRTEVRERLLSWWDGELAGGGAQRAGRTPEAAGQLARDLAAVLVRLPADGTAIGSLAAAATGSAHALDRGALANLVLRAARVIAGLPPVPARSADTDRETWAAVGVVRDETSSTVLALALPTTGAGPTATALAAWRAAGQPAVLTLRHLRLDPPQWALPTGAGVAWVVENPVVLAAVADRALEDGRPAPPVVCGSGQPSTAVLAVLRSLAGAGWQLRYHGDFDPDGIAIAERLVHLVGVQPWRMAAVDYRRAVAAGAGRDADVAPPAASWDAELGAAMAELARVVEEEAVLDELVEDILSTG